MKHIAKYLVLAAAALALALPVATASATPQHVLCGNCGNGGGNYVWGPCVGYPVGTFGLIGNQPVQCLMWNGTPTWLPY